MRKKKGPFGVVQLPEYSITSYGVKCRFPVADLGERYVLVVLLCNTDQNHLGLLLHESNDVIQDPTKKRYVPGYIFGEYNALPKLARFTPLGGDLHNLKFNGKSLKPKWRDIYISNHSSPNGPGDRGLSLFYPLSCMTPTPPFRIPHWLISRLEMLDMIVDGLLIDNNPVGNEPFALRFGVFHLSARVNRVSCYDERFWVFLGTCLRNCPPGSRSVHWAKVVVEDTVNKNVHQWEPKGLHDCESDHIATWPGRSNTFGCSSRTIRLSFARCRFVPQETLVLHLELEGSAHVDIQYGTNVWIPPLSTTLRARKASRRFLSPR